MPFREERRAELCVADCEALVECDAAAAGPSDTAALRPSVGARLWAKPQSQQMRTEDPAGRIQPVATSEAAAAGPADTAALRAAIGSAGPESESFRACGFTVLSSTVFRIALGTGKSPEPADRNVCATALNRSAESGEASGSAGAHAVARAPLGRADAAARRRYLAARKRSRT